MIYRVVPFPMIFS